MRRPGTLRPHAQRHKVNEYSEWHIDSDGPLALVRPEWSHPERRRTRGLNCGTKAADSPDLQGSSAPRGGFGRPHPADR